MLLVVGSTWFHGCSIFCFCLVFRFGVGIGGDDVLTQIAVYFVFQRMFFLPPDDFIAVLSANKLIVIAIIVLLSIESITTLGGDSG